MNRGKKVHIYGEYIEVAERIKRKSPHGRKIAIENTVNKWVEVGMKRQRYLKARGLLKTETVKA